MIPEHRYESVPIGNIHRTYEEVLRDMANPFYLQPFLGYTYVTVRARA